MRTAVSNAGDVGRRARILLIDDDRRVRAAVRRVLQTAHDVVEAQGGEETLALLGRGNRFDLILCDLMMPKMDGPEVYENLKRVYPEVLERVVFLSGGAFTARATAFLETVQPVLLEKPVPQEVLLGLAKRFAGSATPAALKRETGST